VPNFITKESTYPKGKGRNDKERTNHPIDDRQHSNAQRRKRGSQQKPIKGWGAEKTTYDLTPPPPPRLLHETDQTRRWARNLKERERASGPPKRGLASYNSPQRVL